MNKNWKKLKKELKKVGNDLFGNFILDPFIIDVNYENDN